MLDVGRSLVAATSWETATSLAGTMGSTLQRQGMSLLSLPTTGMYRVESILLFCTWVTRRKLVCSVGAFGFLASEELQNENPNKYTGNQALLDQK